MESEAAVDAPAAAAAKPARSTKVCFTRRLLAPRASAAGARSRRLPAAVCVRKSKGVGDAMKKREYAKWSRSEEDAFFTALKVRRGVRRAQRRAFVPRCAFPPQSAAAWPAAADAVARAHRGRRRPGEPILRALRPKCPPRRRTRRAAHAEP